MLWEYFLWFCLSKTLVLQSYKIILKKQNGENDFGGKEFNI
jgi:hypothetical protein